MSRTSTNIGIAVFIISVVASAAYVGYTPSEGAAHDIGMQLASCIQKDGSTLGVNIDESCLHTIVANLLFKNSTVDLLTALEASSSPPVLVQHCHAVGHVIGEETYAHARSLEDALSQCTESCRYACTHGVIGEAVAKEMGLNDEGDDIAHADITKIEELGTKYCVQPAMCHAMGHILFTKFHEYKDSLTTCDKVASHGNREYCYQGVFMESLGGDQSLLFSTTTEERPDDYGYPCDRVDAKYAHACFRYLTSFQNPLFDERKMTAIPERLAVVRTTCETYSGTTKMFCIEGIGFNYWRYFSNNTDAAYRFCGAMRGDERKSCILGAVVGMSDFFSRDDAIRFCSGVNDDDRQLCFNAAFQIMEEKLSAAEITDLCTTSHDSAQCLSAFGAYGIVRNYLPAYEFGLNGEN